MDVDLWVELSGPGASYRIPAFWDGGNTFRVRLVATAPGNWQWRTGNTTGDPGLDNQSGTFIAKAWTEAELDANPNRRGFIRVAANQHTLEYADGTPFFYTGDTWYSMLTGIYAWDRDSGLAGISFQDAVALRKAQGFNGINHIAAFPSDTLKGIWNPATHGKKVAEDGSLPFHIADPEDKKHGVDYTRINPRYWQQADRKMQHLWDHGFAPLMETVRRHESWYSENETERAAFTNYVRYLWARYGCYNLIFSWLHWDNAPAVIRQWKPMIIAGHEALGKMPYGQPETAMAWGSSLDTWYAEPNPVPEDAFDVHNVSNKFRNHLVHDLLRKIYFAKNPKPGINIEPFYAGWANPRHRPPPELDDCTKAQFQMYGSVLNGGFAGHTWGDTYYGGVATNPVEGIPNSDPHVNGFDRYCASSMGHLKAFILDPGHDYRLLQPATPDHLAETDGEWRVLALTADKRVGLGFIAANQSKTDLIKLIAEASYAFEWWDIDEGGWSRRMNLQTDFNGVLRIPNKPDSRGWAFRLKGIE
jgi:hypothetical protein